MKGAKASVPGIGPARERAWLVAILAFAAVTRVAYLLSYRASDPLSSYLVHDAKRYHEWAVALARGDVFEPGAFYQAPLYPYLVSFVYGIAGPNPLLVYALQLAGGVATLFLVHRIARRLFSAEAALLACALGAFYLPLVFYETKLLPASLSVLLAALALDRAQDADRSGSLRSWILCGLALGAGALTNPGMLLFAVAVAVWILLDRAIPWPSRAARLAVVVVSATVVVLPVTFRNYRASGEVVAISTNGGITFYQGNNPAARGVFSTPDGFSGSIFTQREESRRIAEAESGRALTDREVSRFFARKGLRYWIEHPMDALALEARKLLLVLGNREQPLEYNVHLDPTPLRFVFPFPFALLLAFAAAVAVLARPRTRIATPILLLLGAQAAMLLLFYVSGRYRLPAIPALLVLAGGGARLLGERRELVKPFATAVGVAAFSVCVPSLAVPGLDAQQDAVSLCDRAEAWLKTGKPERAAETYREAIALDPDYAFAHLDLAKVLSRTGDRTAAEAEIRRAIALAPGLAEASYDLGVLLYESGRLEEAASAFAAAARFDPASAEAANNLLGTLLRLDRAPEALETWRAMRSRGLPVDPPLDSRLREIERGEP